MNVTEFQIWLGTDGDGKWGSNSRSALFAKYSNTNAGAVNDADIVAFASSLGCSVQQLRAVAKVESAGGGFDNSGRPKILFERHYFHRLTSGRWTPATFSDPNPGGYSLDSWGKLSQACGRDPFAALQSASWGKFQIMGAHWKALGYDSPIDMTHGMVQSEAAHYEAFVRFVKVNGLADELRACSSDPDTCRGFAKGYNGAGYVKFNYHTKIAAALAAR